MGRISRWQIGDKLVIFFLYFLENRFWHIMQIVSLGDNLHDVSDPIFYEKEEKYKETICMKCQILFSTKKEKNISKCRLLKFLPSMQSFFSSSSSILFYLSLGMT